jgi:Flp pilus assembly pilin Flp
MMPMLDRLVRGDAGQDLIEYAMLAAFISIICVTLVRSIGTQVNNWYEGYGATIQTIPGAGSGS